MQDKFSKRMFDDGGYQTITTFYQDFSIADVLSGVEGVKDTYERSKHWISDYKMWTELCMVLNWKSWEWYDKAQEENDEVEKKEKEDLCSLYIKLYEEASDAYHDRYKDDEEAEWYFFKITD